MKEPGKPYTVCLGSILWKTREIISYVLFSIYLLLYIVFTLTIANQQIFPTINRITYFDASVSWSITGLLQFDILIASIIFSASILLLFRKYVSIPLSLMTLIPPILDTLDIVNYQEISNRLFISTLPIIVFLMASSKLYELRKKSKVFTQRKIHSFEIQKFLVWFFFVFLI